MDYHLGRHKRRGGAQLARSASSPGGPVAVCPCAPLSLDCGPRALTRRRRWPLDDSSSGSEVSSMGPPPDTGTKPPRGPPDTDVCPCAPPPPCLPAAASRGGASGRISTPSSSSPSAVPTPP
mmetsp:Transcript_12771/g.30065  ORF Transcript_12771/g.30065 Transcript_12771/m.30065 type:complete len:122 (+) Transcript_12771:87-452(+)